MLIKNFPDTSAVFKYKQKISSETEEMVQKMLK